MTRTQVETFLNDYVMEKNLQHANKLYVLADNALSIVLPNNMEDDYLKFADLVDRWVQSSW